MARFGGGAVGIYTGSTMTFSGITTFFNNSARYGGGIHVIDSTLTLKGRSIFYDNSADYGGGIHGRHAILEIGEVTSFVENNGVNGGGISLASGSQCLLSPNAYVYFRNNHAMQFGGGIFIADEPFLYCFLITLQSISGCLIQGKVFLSAPNVAECYCQFVLKDSQQRKQVPQCTVAWTGVIYKWTALLSNIVFDEMFTVIEYNFKTKCQSFHLMPSVCANVKMVSQTVANEVTVSAYQVRHFLLLWLQLGREMEQFHRLS